MVPEQNKTAGLLIIALWFGVLSGLLEGFSYLGFQSLGWIVWYEQIRPVDENILWASPLMNGLLFLGVGILMLLPARLFARLPWTSIAVWLFATLSAYSLLSVSGRMRERGAVILAIGLGTVVMRWVSRPNAGRPAVFRKTLIPLLAAAVLAGFIGYAWAGLRERVLLSQLPSAPAGAPNVLLIVLDTLRSDRMGAYGYSRPTSPFLDRFARESVQFDAAFSTSSWTYPSHGSMFTGKLPAEHGAVLFPIDLRLPTLAESLASNGYATAGFISNVSPMSKAFGLNKGFHRWENLFFGAFDAASRTLFGRRIRKYLMRGLQPHPALLHMRAPEIERRFLRWLDARPERPFFAVLNFMEMHEYRPPHDYAKRFSTQPEKIIPAGEPLFSRATPYANQDDRLEVKSDAYDASLAYLDANLEHLFSELARRGLDQNLIVVIVSDHGESIGEHGLEEHRNSLYRDQIQVPLLIRFDPHTPEGARVTSTVGVERLPATILELAGIRDDSFSGSLVPFWSGANPPQDSIIAAELTGGDWVDVPRNAPIRKGSLNALVEGDMHLIVEADGNIELFNWRADPREENDLSDDPAYARVVQEMRAKLENLTHPAR